MHIILGGTGHVGSAAARELLKRGERVTVVSRDASKAHELRKAGAKIAEADVLNTEALHRVFRQGKRLYLVNPPAAPATDTDVKERETVASIIAALNDSGLERIVAESTFGAQPIAHGGDLGVLYEMEQALEAQPIPAIVIRAAYYMSNWDTSLESARKDGVVQTMFAPDFKLPMVAPSDIGKVAAQLLTDGAAKPEVHYVEGPSRYSASDVAAAFAEALRKPVRVESVPREKWQQTFQQLGFSEAAAKSYAKMTAITVDEKYDLPEAPVRGATSLQSYISQLLA